MERKAITTKNDFISLVETLATDFKRFPAKWENNTIDSYLETLARYLEDIDGLYKNLNIDLNTDEASWQLFADILIGSSIYE